MKNNTNLMEILEYYKYLEQLSHVSIDDVMNKVTQEVAELIEAHDDGDESEMYNEAGDVLANIYSVSRELGLETDLDLGSEGKIFPVELIILLGKWNSSVQGFREKYSRDDVSLNEVQEVTNSLIKTILNYSDPSLNIEEMISKNVDKFKSRVDNYKPDIDIEDYIESYPDFPKPGIDFKDISPLLKSPEAFRFTCMELINSCKGAEVIVGLDSRGFLFGTMIAEYMGVPFVMIRKQGKLAGEVISKDYGLEYGNDVVELQVGQIEEGQKVAVIDDLLATGGTAKAAIDLVEQVGGEINNVSFVISLDNDELVNKKSRKELEKYDITSIVNYK